MILLAVKQLIARRTATLLAAVGLLTATLGFLLLAGTSRTTQAVITGDVGRAWTAPYDLLVRPNGSSATLEKAEGLVRPNFLSGLTGGITVAQLETIRRVVGVEVAAPVAVAGVVNWPAAWSVDLSAYVDPETPLQVFRVVEQAHGDAQLSTYPPKTSGAILVAPNGSIEVTMSDQGFAEGVVLTVGGGEIDCWNFPDATSPTGRNYQACFGGATPNAIDESVAFQPVGTVTNHPTLFGYFNQPVVIAGIDAAAESALLGLDRCLTSGQYLPEDGGLVEGTIQNQPRLQVIASESSFIDERLDLRIERSAASDHLLDGGGIASVSDWELVESEVVTANDTYRLMFPTLESGIFDDFSSLWTQGDVTYRDAGNDRLVAETVPIDPAVYLSPLLPQGGIEMPPEARDVWFRQLAAHPQERRNEQPAAWELLGRYDAGCLPGFDALAGYRLETYAPPLVRLADGSELAPTRNMAGYVNSPPLVLTTLDGAAFLADPNRYAGRPGDAFISAVRVRVAGVGEPSRAAQAKLARVAADISAATGLEVDIVVGSSPRPVGVDIAAGEYGRPDLAVTEGWAVKGVAIHFLEAVQAQDIAIFGLVLVVASLLVGETAYLSVRRRRKEFGILRALGWSGHRVAALVELEMLVLGLGVGSLAAAMGMFMAVVLGLDLHLQLLLLAIPVAAATAALAGILPAFAAGRGSTLRVMQGSGSSSPLGADGIPRIALGELLGHRRTEGLLGILCVALATFLVGGIFLIISGFSGVLDTSLLGVYVSARVQPFHVVIAALTVVVAIIAVTEVVTMSYLERQRELAALRALGWPRRAVAVLLLTQTATIGLAGGIVGALIVASLGLAVDGALGPTLLSAGLAGAALSAVTLLAAAGPIIYAYGRAPAEALAGDP